MENKFSRIIVVAVLLFFFASSQRGGAQGGQLWLGAFDLGDVRGGLELRVGANGGAAGLRVRLSPRGWLEAPEVSNTKITANRIEFDADVQGQRNRFAGARTGNVYTGTVSPVGQGAVGSWRVARVEAVPTPRADDILPAPTGRFAVGRTTFDWIDAGRQELETKDPTDKRRVVVYLFYPAPSAPDRQPAAYIPDGELMRPVWKDDLTNRLLHLRTHTLADAAVSAARASFPVLVFIPGGAQKALSYTALLEELTSRGYVIAALELPHNAQGMQFPDGTVLSRAAPADRGWEEAKTQDDRARIYPLQVEHWARDASFVLDQLGLANKNDVRLAGKLDLSRVGALGHSKGGQAAGMFRLLDKRVRGAMNIDGNDHGKGFVTLADGAGGVQPFLWLEKQFKWPTSEQLQQAGMNLAEIDALWVDGYRLLATVRGGAKHVVIAQPDINHLDFGDYGLWTTTTDPSARATKLRTLRTTSDFAAAFFDGVLNNDWQTYRKLSRDANLPEVTTRSFGPKWGGR